MILTSFVNKGALIKVLGSLGLVSGGSVGGWYIYDSVIDPRPKVKNLKIEDYFYPPRKNYCWTTFFSSVSLSKGKIYREDPKPNEDNFYEPTVELTKAQAPKTNNVTGCTVMKYSGSEEKKKWAFESETVIKNDKIGIIAWLDINSLESDNQRYQIYFLEKNDKENKWDVKFGFISHEVSKLERIKSPTEKIELTYSNGTDKKWSSNTYDGYYWYQWSWKEDTGDGSVLWHDFLNKPEISKLPSKYIYKGDKLYEPTSAKDCSEALKKWFEPFNTQKGKWISKDK